MKKILITGSSGQVGSYLKKSAEKTFDVIGIGINAHPLVDVVLDISDADALARYLDHARPDIIVHTAALTWVDYSEDHHEETDAVNIRPIEVITKYSKNALQKPYVIFFSTDYVYDGTKKEPYIEEDTPNPLSYYAKSKLRAEKILESYEHHLILRPEGIFSWHPEGKNFFMQVYQSLTEGAEMKVVDDMISNPTYVETLVDAVMKSIEQKLRGIYIATGPEPVNRYEFAMRIAKHFDFDQTKLTPARSSDFPSKAKRPMRLATDSSKLQTALGYSFPPLEDNFNAITQLMRTD